MKGYSFDEGFFRDEEIDGFPVTEAMKRYWAASLHSLEIFDEVCTRHGLKWWADWGTLLGARRNAGFIPWDDDLDVSMLREDYDRFLEIAADELPNEYTVATFDSRTFKYGGFSVVLNHEGVSFDERVLDEYYQCPFQVGFDLYPYDYYPRDEEARKNWRIDGIRYLIAMEHIRSKGANSPEAKKAIADIGGEALALAAKCDHYELLEEFGKRVERIAGRFKSEDADKLMTYSYFIRDNNQRYMDKEWVSQIVETDFMTGSIPVPKYADEILSVYYGKEFMVPKQVSGAHSYPLYSRDIREMVRFLEDGGMKLTQLPPVLSYIKKEADIRGIPYKA